MCQQDGFPAIKWFSATDASTEFPPVTCYRVDKKVVGVSASTWADWFKLLRVLEKYPWE